MDLRLSVVADHVAELFDIAQCSHQQSRHKLTGTANCDATRNLCQQVCCEHDRWRWDPELLLDGVQVREEGRKFNLGRP
jgi:hypothetical protein